MVANYFIMADAIDNQEPTFTITDRKRHVPVVTLWTQDNVKLFHQVKSGFKRTINWNKYQLKATTQTRKKNLDYLFDPHF